MSSPASSTAKLDVIEVKHDRVKPWYRKPKIIFLLAMLLAAAVAVAVAVPIVVLREKEIRTFDEALYFPQGSSSGAFGGRKSNASYDVLLVTGSSYSDNAHPRAANLQGTHAGRGYWKGRWSNGRIWVEYLQELLQIPEQVNYAYGGATIQRQLSPSGPPTAGEQISTYLSDLASNASVDSSVYTRKVLSASFTTTNDINSVWKNYLDAANPAYGSLDTAKATISESARLLISNLARIIPSSNQTGRVAPDFLILPILPVDLTPQSRQLAREHNTSTASIAAITRQYNAVLLEGARNLSKTLSNRGSVYSYDVTAWFNAMANDTSRYGISTLSDGCNQVGCNDPTKYVWWDHLHLETHSQERLAKSCAQVILHSNTTL